VAWANTNHIGLLAFWSGRPRQRRLPGRWRVTDMQLDFPVDLPVTSIFAGFTG